MHASRSDEPIVDSILEQLQDPSIYLRAISDSRGTDGSEEEDGHEVGLHQTSMEVRSLRILTETTYFADKLP